MLYVLVLVVLFVVLTHVRIPILQTFVPTDLIPIG